MESWSSAIRMVSLPRRLRAGEGSREEPRADRETSVEGRYAEEAALLRFTVDVDESAMLLDDAMNGGETHAGAAAALFGGEERLEDTIASFRVHGHAGIGDGKNNVGTGDDIGDGGGSRKHRGPSFQSRW